MISFPNAKINLGLYVTAKRPDGFHDIESVFLPISLVDVLEIIPAERNKVEFALEGIRVEGDVKENICIKAYELLQKDFDLPGIKACLLKNIPTGAGLGGGSSDGAFMLRLLDKTFALHLPSDRLTKYAAVLGSDCPFFLANQACFVSGRGENLAPLPLDMRSFFITVVHPGIHVSTAEAYSILKPRPADLNLTQLSTSNMGEWRNTITNHFEAPVIALHPEIGAIKKKLYELGAIYASMSGSGSSVYGIFEDQKNLAASFENYFCWSGKFL